MTLRADISRLLDDNQLDDATVLARDHVKSKPSDKEGRHIYIDLLILAGEYEKADAQCNLAATFSPQDSVGFSLLRQQLRAMAARDAWFETGAVPEFPNGPSVLDHLAIKANVSARNGDTADAATALAELDEKRGEVAITLNGKPANDIRDLDDRVPHALEVLTNGGRYLWIDYSRIESLSIAPMNRPRDLAFRDAELTLRDGAIASVLIPAIYHGSSGDVALLLGRETQWSEDGDPLVTGRGQRCLLIGDDLVSFHEITTLSVPSENEERQIARG
ncbi:nitrogen fixation protein [Agrobacterium larrymoorei]|uniref:type VI secretion system accessory protein TagJ n=1 Tax=Agrobacterium larrymoorei TaxID=160699 RepID=UPI0015735560|nr:type VI secretion system accessory protein TagJ [Agrobacterium larrymoorei]NTJ44604.1 nitrogen fixation protein [Agrobacterium larrymoorei]